jgi:hypothetical protein
MATTTKLTVTLALICIHADGFNVQGKQYQKGDAITPEDLEHWPEGSLETRLENKFVAYRPVKPEPDAPAPVLDPAVNALDLEKMTVEDLVTYAKEKFDMDLDPAQSHADLALEVRTLISMAQE